MYKFKELKPSQINTLVISHTSAGLRLQLIYHLIVLKFSQMLTNFSIFPTQILNISPIKCIYVIDIFKLGFISMNLIYFAGCGSRSIYWFWLFWLIFSKLHRHFLLTLTSLESTINPMNTSIWFSANGLTYIYKLQLNIFFKYKKTILHTHLVLNIRVYLKFLF